MRLQRSIDPIHEEDLTMSANQDIEIGGRCIGRNHAPFVIAEMSGNHNQSLERA